MYGFVSIAYFVKYFKKRVIGTIGATYDYAHWLFYLLLQHGVTALFSFPYTFTFSCLYLSVCLSISLRACVCACLRACLSVCLSACLSVYVSVCLCVSVFVCLSVLVSVYMSLCSTVELWSLELACLEHQGSLELVRQSRQFPYTFIVKIHPRLEQ